ncbi:hypothetical protein B0H17DRAFT_1207062, partial [Mycena rosella]
MEYLSLYRTPAGSGSILPLAQDITPPNNTALTKTLESYLDGMGHKLDNRDALRQRFGNTLEWYTSLRHITHAKIDSLISEPRIVNGASIGATYQSTFNSGSVIKSFSTHTADAVRPQPCSHSFEYVLVRVVVENRRTLVSHQTRPIVLGTNFTPESSLPRSSSPSKRSRVVPIPSPSATPTPTDHDHAGRHGIYSRSWKIAG